MRKRGSACAEGVRSRRSPPACPPRIERAGYACGWEGYVRECVRAATRKTGGSETGEVPPERQSALQTDGARKPQNKTSTYSRDHTVQSPPASMSQRPSKDDEALTHGSGPATNHSDSIQSKASSQNEGSPTTNELLGIGALLLILIGASKKILEELRAKSCTRCRSPFKGEGPYCRRCDESLRQEAQRNYEARQAQERARADEQRRQREKEEERARKRIRTMEELHRLTGPQFEELIASLFTKDGYKVHRCGGSGDEGIDLILKIGDFKDVVQCKRWRNDIGSPIVREFYGSMMHANARHGYVITTASFSQSAASFARGKPISLISGIDILRWIEGNFPSDHSSRGGADSAHQPEPKAFDPYEVLGISRDARPEEIKAAYRREMANYHPDKVAHLGPELQKLANRKAQEINRAYEYLIGVASAR